MSRFFLCPCSWGESPHYCSTGTAGEWWLKCTFLSLYATIRWCSCSLLLFLSQKDPTWMTVLASPRDKECGGVWLSSVVEIQPSGGMLVVQTHHQQHLSWLEPAAMRFSEQQSPVTCRNSVDTMQAPGKEEPKSWVHFSKLPNPAKNPCHWGITWCLQMLRFLPGLIF